MSEEEDKTQVQKYSSDPSERAAQLRAEGKFGGAVHGRKGGRPRKKRASEIVAEEAERNANLIIKALREGLQNTKRPDIRLQAAKQWLEIESKEHDLKIKHEKDLDELSTEDLVEHIANRLGGLADVGAFNIPDADVVVEEPLELEAAPAEVPDPRERGQSAFARRRAS